jgi:hypothetical protein
MRTSASTAKTLTAPRNRADHGQAALVLVVAFTVLLTIIGGVMVNSFVNNAPILQKASLKRMAYRSLTSGINAYLSAINANPYLASCNTSDASSNLCAGLTYQSWTQVAGTNTGNGVIPEYYMFNNPQVVLSSSNKAVTSLEVEVVGAAGFPGSYIYYSSVAHFTPANDYLNNVWWTNYESSDFSETPPNAANCVHYWVAQTVGSHCGQVYWVANDNVTGPMYTNDSIFLANGATLSNVFSTSSTTADPLCLNYTYGGSCNTTAPTAPPNPPPIATDGHALEASPISNTELKQTAIQGGCYYQGPTTITFNAAGTMNVVSQLSPGYPATLTQSQPSTDTSVCATNGVSAYPKNGVVYVDASPSSWVNADNPFYSSTNSGLSQTVNCSGCYFGNSAQPATEGDAFVSDAWSTSSGSFTGSFSGDLDVAAANNVIIQGPITYEDCTGSGWTSSSGWTAAPATASCPYNSATSTTPNDMLGLIANNFIEVNRPEYNSNSVNGSNAGKFLPSCGGTTWVPPLCDPSTSTGTPEGAGLTVDATVLALNQSFVVNNYGDNDPPPQAEGTLLVYGSIQQDSRGPVGLTDGNGYLKDYVWDARLGLVSPPFYLTPGTASWNLNSSAESYTGLCPPMPPAQAAPVPLASGQDFTFATSTHNPPTTNNPVNTSPNNNSSAWAACTTP